MSFDGLTGSFIEVEILNSAYSTYEDACPCFAFRQILIFEPFVGIEVEGLRNSEAFPCLITFLVALSFHLEMVGSAIASLD